MLCEGGGEHKDTAMKITNSLINIRAITAHFQPRIEAWLAAQQLSTPSEVGFSHHLPSNIDSDLRPFLGSAANHFELTPLLKSSVIFVDLIT